MENICRNCARKPGKRNPRVNNLGTREEGELLHLPLMNPATARREPALPDENRGICSLQGLHTLSRVSAML